MCWHNIIIIILHYYLRTSLWPQKPVLVEAFQVFHNCAKLCTNAASREYFWLPYLLNYCILNAEREREKKRERGGQREVTSIGGVEETLPHLASLDQRSLILIICWQLTTLMNSSNYLPGEHSTLIIHTLTHTHTHSHTRTDCADILPYYVYATYARLP